MNKTIIDGIGNSMKHWANYIFDVKRGELLNEGSIKYGISEYLVSTENLYKEKVRLAIGQPKINDVIFEQIHAVFKNRSVDLNFKVQEYDKVTDVYFEFKYIKKIPLSSQERDRYIDDFFRLASLAKQSNEENKIECFFMLVGLSSYANTLMGPVGDEVDVNNNERMAIADLPDSVHSVITKCLPISKDNPKITVLRDLNYDGNSLHLTRFRKDYKYRDTINKNKRLRISDQMIVKLKYTTDSTDEKIGVYIWQIEIQ